MNIYIILLYFWINRCIGECYNGIITESNYYCEFYYICEYNKYSLRVCDNMKVFSNYNCITQQEYKNINGEYCTKCPSKSILTSLNDTECSNISHTKCCAKDNNKITYCGLINGKRIWKTIEDEFLTCDRLFNIIS